MEEDILDNRIKINYICKFCKNTWNLEYPVHSTPPAIIVCPKCKKRGPHQKPYNFFKDGNK